MPKKTTILIVILALVTGILIFLAIRSDNSLNLTTEITPTQSQTVQPYALLSFSQGYIDSSTTSGEVSVDIILDTAGKPVSGAQAELSYDPNIFTNVRIETAQNSIFGPNATVLFSSVEPEQGRISYAVGIPIDGQEIVGVGPIATITFNIIQAQGSSQMTFLPKSTVQNLSTQESVLLGTQSLNVGSSENTIPLPN